MQHFLCLQDTINLYRNMHKWIRRKYSRWSLEDLTRERMTLTEWTQMVKEAQQLQVQDVFWQMLMQIPGTTCASLADRTTG